MILCRHEGANTDIASNIRVNNMRMKEFGTVECCDRSGVLESVELECGWSG